VTGIFEANGKTKAELFSAINKWISDNYKSANRVIQLNDAEGGNIIIEGITEGKFNLKPFWPKLKRDKYEIVKFNHLIELNIVDNKLKMIYKITNLANLKHSKAKTECANECDINILNCINFNGVDDNSILAYNEFLESNYRMRSIEKIKIDKLLKPMFEELNSNLISNIKITMEGMAKATTATSNGL
jgi:hypothetical protein